MGTMQFWLHFDNKKESLQLPVNPEQISVSGSHSYEDVHVTQLGEYTVIGNRTLKSYSFSSFFPRDYHPGYCEYDEIPRPWETVALIERWMHSGKTMRLTVTGTPINDEVTLRSFNYREQAGSPGDVYFDMEFKQYVHVEFRKINEESKESAAGGQQGTTVSNVKKRPNPKEKLSSYEVQNGDTLWKISQKTLGRGDRWQEIYQANLLLIGKNPLRLRPGWKLVIP
ncbi:LysM peptidoglycan-binding domain-containing protein [Ectobacillus ponti]|uniref:LysM peptidoglycan-binding domain-containing protein n=1 Tax=Ectobacillus ponti TaxID=2961894 RepID=A0AA42BQ85_9BACI|nr:LysM peptidoglycan-binding domain-containing protein [Ectobacillus ponti]MCP8970045.1 LysM peptidoglycan-binding domain-containing protein [Ectobacillus ponti]